MRPARRDRVLVSRADQAQEPLLRSKRHESALNQRTTEVGVEWWSLTDRKDTGFLSRVAADAGAISNGEYVIV